MKRLLGSYLMTTICSWTLAFIVPLHILGITKSATWASLAYVAAMAPYILITPFAGVWSDRYSKRNFLLGGDFLNMLTAVLLCWVLSQPASAGLPVLMVLLNFILASISAVHHPMFQSVAPEMLESSALKNFNSMINGIDNIVHTFAPMLASILLGMFTKPAVLLLSATGYLVSLPLLFLLPKAASKLQAGSSVFREMLEGVKYVIADANLIAFSLLFFFVNFGLAIIGANLIYIYQGVLGVPEQSIGYHFSIIGIGSVLGSVLAAKLIDRVSDAGLIVASCVLAGVLALLAGLSRDPFALSAIWAAATGCLSVVVVTFFTFRQRVVPKEILGRTVGITRLISYLAIPPASVLGGVLMDRTQSSAVILGTGGIAILLGAAIAVCTPALRVLLFSWRTVPRHDVSSFSAGPRK